MCPCESRGHAQLISLFWYMYRFWSLLWCEYRSLLMFVYISFDIFAVSFDVFTGLFWFVQSLLMHLYVSSDTLSLFWSIYRSLEICSLVFFWYVYRSPMMFLQVFFYLFTGLFWFFQSLLICVYFSLDLFISLFWYVDRSPVVHLSAGLFWSLQSRLICL